jgi:hypothetical protein
MPAIDLARLKTQSARLVEHFDKPEAFVHDLQELLDFYTNRTMRSAQLAQRIFLPTHHTPRPVLRQIEMELKALADAHPLEAVELTGAMWKAGSLESRLLAARLLGMIPPAQAMPALTRLPEWLNQSTDAVIQHALLNDALDRLRKENPEALFILTEEWLKSPRSGLQRWGLRALIPLFNLPNFENLPAVFRILRPAVEAAGPATQLDLQACLAALGRVSLTETLYFLREILNGRPSAMLLRTLKRMLPALPPELQSGLREMLRPD